MSLFSKSSAELQGSSSPLNLANLNRPPKSFVFLVAVTAALTAVHFGYVISNINVASNIFGHCDEFASVLKSAPSSHFGLQGCFKVSTSAWGLVGAGVPIGGWIGSLTGGSFVKVFGLQKSILLLNVPLLLGYLLMSFSSSIWMLIAGRLLQGFVCGLSGVAVPSYISAITPQASSAVFVNFFQLFLVSGALIAELVSYGADLGRHLWRWRFSFGAGILVCFTQVLLSILGYLPKTPAELEEKGEVEQAGRLRLKLGFEPSEAENLKNSNSNSNLPKVSDMNTDDASSDSLPNLLSFKIAKANKSLVLGLILHAGQQISGVNAVFFYSALIFSGGTAQTSSFRDPPTLIPIVLTLVNVLSTIVAIWLLKRAGRRPIALLSSCGSAACLFLLAFCMRAYPQVSVWPMIGFIVLFAVGLGPIPWLMMPEIFPPHWPLTMSAISVCISANWIVNIMITGLFPYAADRLSERKEIIFSVFGLFGTIIFVALYFLMPETRNRLANFI